MKISLIDNGLDSITKAYQHLQCYERILVDEGTDKQRFFALKDAIMSMQHGVEILFKYILMKENEVLLFSKIDDSLLRAYVNRRNNEIQELYEEDKVYTVTFKEAVNRVRSICGKEISSDLQRRLTQLENWRNKLIHSTINLSEQQISTELKEIFDSIDIFFTQSIGVTYVDSQEKQNLHREYRRYVALHKHHANEAKGKVMECLTRMLALNGISSAQTNSCVKISSFDVAMAIIQELQKDQHYYGADFSNGHCSGSAILSAHDHVNKIIKIEAPDNRSDYFIRFAELLLYIPKIESDYSPIFFIYSQSMDLMGSSLSSYTRSDECCSTQVGLLLERTGKDIWDKAKVEKIMHGNSLGENYTPVKELIRFTSPGLNCFLNIQRLEYHEFDVLFGDEKYRNIEGLERDLKLLFT